MSRLRDAGRGKQADEIVAALAFGAVLDRARDALNSGPDAGGRARPRKGDDRQAGGRQPCPRQFRRVQDRQRQLPEKGCQGGSRGA